ncbi:MAG: hypothetical protein AB1730_28060 [Myxococcota bacterium]|jgi:hypothetical protein
MASSRKSNPTRNKSKAVVKPVRSPEKALKYWSREVGNYNPMVVRVVGRRGSQVYFNIWDVETQKEFDNDGEPFVADLTDGEMAWGSLPSTAQLVTPGQGTDFGLLLLTEAWLVMNNVSASAGGGGKWPKTVSL